MSQMPACELCSAAEPAGTLLVAHRPLLRVLRVLDAPAFPAFYRVVWNRHIAEWSDLMPDERATCMEVVVAVERVLRRLAPRKINIASLGNMVPHLHWHVVARFDWDSHFPQPIWGEPQRNVDPAAERLLLLPLGTLDAELRGAL